MKLCLTFLSVVAGFISISVASDIPKKPFHLNEKIEKEIGYAQAVQIGGYALHLGLRRCRRDAGSDSRIVR
jgi:hypothetical protein